ncbi:unnamed protein product [Prorocentrum cordatum]|uniref:Uncharacterized protein n=1 Tax=Prorocentrum cordatum TaxID=2364126 RepID=A0ABN9PC87_9DINO|nr:unnamed protein product [Polarella glacialis]
MSITKVVRPLPEATEGRRPPGSLAPPPSPHSRPPSGHPRQNSEHLLAGLDVEIRKARETLQASQRQRFQTEGENMRLVEDISAELEGLLRQENSQREAVQGKLLSLLEEICSRIENSFCGGQADLPGLRQMRRLSAASADLHDAREQVSEVRRRLGGFEPHSQPFVQTSFAPSLAEPVASRQRP